MEHTVNSLWCIHRGQPCKVAVMRFESELKHWW
jgi:hypothetical protein